MNKQVNPQQAAIQTYFAPNVCNVLCANTHREWHVIGHIKGWFPDSIIILDMAGTYHNLSRAIIHSVSAAPPPPDGVLQ